MPAQIEGRRTVAIGNFERGAHPFPEFNGARLPKIEIRERPARLKLVIDARSFEQPSFGRREIAARLRGQAETNARGRGKRTEGSGALQHRRRVLAVIFKLQSPQRKMVGVVRQNFRRAPDRARHTASAQATLRDGVTIHLASASSASVSESRLPLWKGVGQVAAPESYEIEAGGLVIRSASGTGRFRVGWSPGGEIEVSALTGRARVASAGTGVVLASIPAGQRMNFAMQAGAARAVTPPRGPRFQKGHLPVQRSHTA